MLKTQEMPSLDAARLHPISDYRVLKEDFGRLLTLCGGANTLEGMTRVRPSALYQMASLNEVKHFPPVDVVADLEAMAQDPVVTRHLARLAGYTLMPIRPSGKLNQFSQVLARLGKEVSDVFASAAKALEDDKLTAKEAKKVLRDVDEAMGVLEELRGRLKNIADAESSTFHTLMAEAA